MPRRNSIFVLRIESHPVSKSLKFKLVNLHGVLFNGISRSGQRSISSGGWLLLSILLTAVTVNSLAEVNGHHGWKCPLIVRFVGPTWGPSGSDRTQVGPMLAPWTLLSGSVLSIGLYWTVSSWQWAICIVLSIVFLLNHTDVYDNCESYSLSPLKPGCLAIPS